MNNHMNNQLISVSRRSQLESERLAQKMCDFLIRRKLNPAFSGFYLTRWNEMDLFIAILDTEQIGNQKPYTGDILHQLSTDLGGRPVYLSNTTGLRYVVPISAIPKLPRKIDLPSAEILGGLVGIVGIGQNFSGRIVAEKWQKLGHVLVTGITGSGKSMLLRSLVAQAMRQDMLLALSDLDGTSFPIPPNHPALFAPIVQDGQGAHELIQRVLGECEHRKALYQSVRGAPENIDEYNELALKSGMQPLKRILLILDEFSSTMMEWGGARSVAANILAQLGMRGRKFGITVIFAAHEFTKEQVGVLRTQCQTIICFRTSSKELAARMGCAGAERIPPNRPGLCITYPWGVMQAFYADKSLLMDGEVPAGELLDPEISQLFTVARDRQQGRVTLSLIQERLAVGKGEAVRRQREWALRGWIAKSTKHANAYVLTDRGLALLGEKPETPETPGNAEKPAGNPETDQNTGGQDES